MAGHMNFDTNKFKNLLLYISSKYENAQFFGSLKLNKALFFCDFYSYGIFNNSITGATYKHLPQGPAPSCLVPIRKEMEEDESIVIKKESVFGKIKHRIIALKEVDVNVFSPQEIKLIDDILSQLEDKNGTELSNITHEHYLGWKLTGEGEEIPYFSIFLSSDKPTLLDIEQAEEIALSCA